MWRYKSNWRNLVPIYSKKGSKGINKFRIFSKGGCGQASDQSIQLQTRVGPTKFNHFKTHTLENREGVWTPDPLSGSVHEKYSIVDSVGFMCTCILYTSIKEREKLSRVNHVTRLLA